MPISTRDEVVKDKRKSHGFTPYDQAGRRAKMGALRSWSPSIWNALTFWKSGDASSEDDGENHEGDAPNGRPNGDPNTPNSASASTGANGNANGTTGNENSAEGDLTDSSFTSNHSEGQVSALLTLQPSRQVRFRLPSSDQERLNSRLPLAGQTAQQPAPVTPVRQNQLGNYVAPIPPSSPLRHVATPQEDPLTQVVNYIAHRTRGPLNPIEALGLNSLLQQSVYEAGRPTAAQQHPQQLSNPFIFGASTSASSSVSPSPPPIPPTFTNPNTDFTALLASSSAPSPSDPNTPGLVNRASPSRSSASPSRTLTQNPNGTLYYQGGGSARFRYRSSSFSASPTRRKVAFPRGFGESPKTNGFAHPVETPSPSDGKRRRVGEERESSTVQASGSTPAMTNGTGGVSRTPITPPTTSLRFGASAAGSRLLANTPARPSPLRQSVRADSSSPSTASPGSVNGVSPRGRGGTAESPSRTRASEKASEIMAGIINDATPKKDNGPDVRNPYQANNRSPTKRSRKIATTKAPRPPPRPTRSAALPPPPQPKKLSALETIQRTAPQAQAQTGSKRSHTGMPSPAPKASAVNGLHAPKAEKPGSSADKPVVIEIDDQDDEEEQAKRPPAKKQRQEKEKEKEVDVEVEDVDMSEPVPAPENEKVIQPSEVVEPNTSERQNQPEGSRPVLASPFGKKVPMARFQSAPKEPSPLRQSFQPDAPSSPPKESSSGSSASKPPPLPSTSALSPFASTFTPSPFSQTSSSVPFAQTFPSAPLPQTSISTSPLGSASDTTATAHAVASTSAAPPLTDWRAIAKQQALDAPADKLPTFVFTITSSAVVSNTQRDAALAASTHELPKYDFSAAPAPAKPQIKAFDWKAAGLKPMVATGWTCGTCFISNDNNATKCISCESTR